MAEIIFNYCNNLCIIDIDRCILSKACFVPHQTLYGHGSQIRPQLSAASHINRPQPKVIIAIVLVKLKLWAAAGCEAKVAAELNSRLLPDCQDLPVMKVRWLKYVPLLYLASRDLHVTGFRTH